jgi:hypothetical protein
MTVEEPRKAVLLGAGFSYDLGMPLAAEVTELFLGIFNATNAKKLGDMLSAQQPYGKDRPIKGDEIRAGFDLLLRYKAEGGNYEDFLARIESLPFRDTADQDSHHYLFGVFYELLYMILVAYQATSYLLLYPHNRPCFSGLTNLLSAGDKETWIFSLNHDLYAECLAIDFGIPITYGDTEEISFPLSNLKRQDQVCFSCSPREKLPESPGWFRGRPGINLVRLHGGLGELEYKNGALLCNPKLNHRTSVELIREFQRIEAMGYYSIAGRVPSGKDRVVTGPDGSLDVVCRTIRTGGRKYSKTTNFKKGEEKLKLLDDVLREADELTIIGYAFGDYHINSRILNAMVLNPRLRTTIVDPAARYGRPDFLQQFDYDQRIVTASCGAAQWMGWVGEKKWDAEQASTLKKGAAIREVVKQAVGKILPR